MSSAQYRILAPDGTEREAGSADAEVAGGALVLAPSAGAVLRVPFGHISAITEPEPFTVRITLADGNAIDLSRLGVMRTQLLAELRDGRADDAASAAAVVGEAAVFDGLAGGQPAEIRVYDDALLVIGTAGSERVSFSFAGPVQVQDYVLTVEVTGREPLTLSRLGRRTGELAGLLTERLGQARSRTAAFLASLLPGLDPMALRQAAALLRDGVAVPAATLDGIHPDLTRTLIQVAALPARREAIADLTRRTDLTLGFKQLASVRRPAAGVTPWQDHAATPHLGGHESPGGAFRPGLPGLLAASALSAGPPAPPPSPSTPLSMIMGQNWHYLPETAHDHEVPLFGFGEGYGAYGDYWAFRALGAGMNSGPQQRPMTPRPDMARGTLTPASEDLSALTAAGADPAVLAFALASRNGLVAYEVLNQPEPMTFVYRAGGEGGLAAINRALDDAGFQAAALHAEGLTAPSRPGARPSPLAQALAAQVPHDTQWPERIAALLGS